MRKKIFRLKTLLNIIIILASLECIYLFVLPLFLNCTAGQELASRFIKSKFQTEIEYSGLKFKTHVIPALSASSDFINISDSNGENILRSDKLAVKISLLPLILKKLNIQSINSGSLDLNIKRSKDGSFNIGRIFKLNGREIFKLKLNNTLIGINSCKIALSDLNTDEKLFFDAKPLCLKFDKKGRSFRLITKGELKSDGLTGDFDVNLALKTGFSLKNTEDILDGSCLIYNLNLKFLLPFLQKYADPDISDIRGFVDFLGISAGRKDKNTSEVTLNAQFNDIVFNKRGWKSHIEANGQNKVNLTALSGRNNINVLSFGYEADNINIKADGEVNFADKTPGLDINVEVKNSKAENIASVLPPALAPRYMTIEKIKTYGIYGDIEGKVNIKGKIPRPDITGYVNGNNIHILDKPLHKLHKGTVKITFDKRILNMDILIEMLNRQRAVVKGCVYMFRDGINNVDVKTTNNIDFPLAQKLVVPISRVFNFQLGPVPDMNIKAGKGVIDINIQGSADVIRLCGFSSFRSADLTYKGLYGEVKGGKGRLDFKDDTIKFKSERAFVKNNPLSVSGIVKINDSLNFDISSPKADAADVIEIIKKSRLLKDVKDGLDILESASGAINLFVNIKANIVPVPFGEPPLPPDEAFTDIKTGGFVSLNKNTCTIKGFKTPVHSLEGTVKFTEKLVDLNDIKGIAETSPVNISGRILTDMNTKIPDADITVTGRNIKLGNTIKFLAESYLYPKNYPDLSPLYNLDSKHDLYFKYKAKSIDFITDKAYAVISFADDNTDSRLGIKSGTVVLDKSRVEVKDAEGNLFDSKFVINGHADNVDTADPVYNFNLQSDKFNLSNLNSINELSIIPEELLDILNEFDCYEGTADINASLRNNKLTGSIEFLNSAFNYKKLNIPVRPDDFVVDLDDNKIHINNMTASIGDIPLYADVIISDFYAKPYFKGYFTSKLTDEFIKDYILQNQAGRIKVTGDINLSAEFDGTMDNINIKPKLTLNPYADIAVENNSIGEIADKREFSGIINLQKNKINVKNLDYIKYISSQNNRVYPITFANADAVFDIDDNKIEPEEINIKTYRNISARILNLLLKTPVFRQGSLNCDLKYRSDKIRETANITGKLEARNLDIPLFDTVIKSIRAEADKDNINLNILGFITDSRININSVIANDIKMRPEVKLLKINAESIDNDVLLRTMSKVHTAMNENNQIKHFDLKELKISRGLLNIRNIAVKSFSATDFTGDFSIDEHGIFKADNIKLNTGSGDIHGEMSYNLNTSDMECDFVLNNVDSNYIAETLFNGRNQIFGDASGKVFLRTKGVSNKEIIKNLSGFLYFDINDGRMPKLGSLEYLLRAGNIIRSGITGFTINNILELLNLVKSGYFSKINGSCTIENGIADNIEIFSKGDNMSLYIHGTYDISRTQADMEVLGKISKQISTVFGALGNTSINTFFKLIPGISMFDFGRKDFVEDVEKIPPFTGGYYDSRTFQAVINGNINDSNYVQSFKWVQ